MAVLFNGHTIITPSVETAVDDSRMYPISNPNGNTLALLGESVSGIPKTPTRIRSPRHARQVLGSGPLYEAVIRAFAPSSAVGSPSAILAVRVNPATQSSLDLLDGTGGVSLSLKSSDYGSSTKAIEVRLETGSKLGFKVSIRQLGSVYIRDNIGVKALTIQYTGSEASATATVANDELVLDAPAATPVRTFTLSDYANAAALAEAIDGMADWTCTVPRGSERFDTRYLDKTSALACKTTAVTLAGNTKALYDYFKSASEILIDATLPANNTTPPVNIPWTPLAGGVNGNVVSTDWEEALAALHEIDVGWLVPLTDEPSIWAMVAAHCEYLSTIKRERRAFVGGATGITAVQAAADALSINSDRVAYVWPGIYENDPVTRQLVLKEAYFAAVNLAAAFSSISPGETMSRKALSVAGAEVRLREPTDTDSLLEAGVIPLVESPTGVIVSQAITTWMKDDRYNRREVSVGAAVDYVCRAIRANLEMFLGTRGSPFSLSAAKSRVESILNDLSRQPPLGSGILVGDSQNPPYRNVALELQGDILRVSFECSPVIPINYVLVGISVEPYAGASV